MKKPNKTNSADKTIFIKLLKYGESLGLEKCTIDDALAWARKNNFISEEGDSRQKDRFIQLFLECFHGVVPVREEATYVLKNEYYFRLIEYKELKESRIASKSANRNAFIAIGISLTSIVLGVYATWFQLNTEISVDSSQVASIIDASKPPQSQNVELSSNQLSLVVSELQSLKQCEVKIDDNQYRKILEAINHNN